MSTNDDAVGVLRTIRDAQPAHYLFKIESFSVLTEENIEKYESDDFEVGGYKWELCFYPNGNKKRNGDGHISLYLVIRDTDKLPQGWEVNVQFKFFVFDHIRDKYLTIQDADGRTRRYHQMRTEWGISMESLHSEEFIIKGQKWKLDLYPKGNGKAKGESLSVFLSVADRENLPLKWKIYAKFKLRVRDQVQSVHQEKKVSNWFCSSRVDWGFSRFMLLTDLNDKSKGFMVKDTVIIEPSATREVLYHAVVRKLLKKHVSHNVALVPYKVGLWLLAYRKPEINSEKTYLSVKRLWYPNKIVQCRPFLPCSQSGPILLFCKLPADNPSCGGWR
ncbi:hypothetical protein Vadar_012609 [Vaccinium darrowii]|uniref:Uncharacterized protein n=1 Tax=Vaccinium darrowii TaxID=229202 RepID=A0ACB7ZJ43_9ERIC|nr:hypothetical protein Vadar_012609 [Vaccinium darrowii]